MAAQNHVSLSVVNRGFACPQQVRISDLIQSLRQKSPPSTKKGHERFHFLKKPFGRADLVELRTKITADPQLSAATDAATS
jgi:hypothetical protein